MKHSPISARPLQTAAAVFAVAAAVLAAPAAQATEHLPGEIQKRLSLLYVPQCTLCHQEGKTGNGTVVTPFGINMRARGLTAQGGRNGQGPLYTALDQMGADAVDSDGDGHSDIDELKAGTDPNVYGAVPIALAEPVYGCASVGAGALFPALFALLLFALRRRAPQQ